MIKKSNKMSQKLSGVRRFVSTGAMVIVLLGCLSSCDLATYKYGNGEEALRTVQVEPFEELSIGGNYEVFLEKGEQPRVVIETDDNIIDFITVESSNGIVSIYNEQKIKGKDGIKIFVTYTRLTSLSSGGASTVYTNGEIESDELEVSMTGAGLVELELQVEDLDLSLSGAGVVKLSGSATRSDMSLTGAGSLEAFDLETGDCQITISGVGSAEVNVSGELDARVSGLGGVQYIGNPSEVKREVSGIGKIQPARTPDQ